MDNALWQKWIKLSFAAPLAYSAALISDISAGTSFLAPLMVFVILFYLSGSIAVKEQQIVLIWKVLAIAYLFSAVIAGLGWTNSIDIFLAILVLDIVIQMLIPPAICLALLPLTAYNATTVLTSSTPYTSAVDNILLLSLGLGAGWLVERLFWPTNNKTILEKQISQTFKLLNQLSHLAFFPGLPSAEQTDAHSLEALNRQISSSISSTSKTMQTSFASGELAPNNRENWDKMISIQYQLLVQLLALLQLLKDNQENELLQELLLRTRRHWQQLAKPV